MEQEKEADTDSSITREGACFIEIHKSCGVILIPTLLILSDYSLVVLKERFLVE
jgi:hypothetical protein